MASRARHSITEVLDNHELQKLPQPETTNVMPDAEVILWDDEQMEEEVAVTSSGNALAASLDRFKGSMTPSLASSLRGFYGEFTENGERIVIVNDELKDILGDRVYARTQDSKKSHALEVITPEDVLDTVRKYDQEYAGSLENDFWSYLESNRILMPAYFDNDGVIDQVPMTLMNSNDPMMMSEQKGNQIINHFLDEKEVPNPDKEQSEADYDLFEAPVAFEDSDKEHMRNAEYVLDFRVPGGYDTLTWEFDNLSNSLAVGFGESLDEVMRVDNANISKVDEVLEYQINNGVGTMYLK